MSNFLIVGLAGAAGAGKDAAADALTKRGLWRHGFSKPLKYALNVMFDWDMDQWGDREWKESAVPDIGKSPRQMAQTLGTEWGRMLVNQDLWLLLAKRQIDLVRRMGVRGIVFTDCRFENEAAFIRSAGGRVIRVVRPNANYVVAAHASENPLPPRLVDAQIVNDGTPADLGRRICDAVFYPEPLRRDDHGNNALVCGDCRP